MARGQTRHAGDFRPGNRAGKGSLRPPGRKGLTPAQERFAREYVVDLDAIRAAMVVWPRLRSRVTASNKASHVLAMPKVAALVAELKVQQFKRLDLKGDDVLQELMRLANVDPGRLFDEDGAMLPVHRLPEDIRRCISSIEYDQLTGRPKVRFWSKPDALAMLAKHFKVCVERVEVKDVSDRAVRLQRALARVRAVGATMPPEPAVASPP